jgi:hypothetical protein
MYFIQRPKQHGYWLQKFPPQKKRKREGKNQGNSHKFKKAGLSPRNTQFEPPKYLVSVKEMSGKNSLYFVQG